MGIVGDFVDSLNPVEKQRILDAEEWRGAEDGGVSKKCVVYHAYGGVPRRATIVRNGELKFPKETVQWYSVGDVYDRLVLRFGKERIVSAIKKRARNA